MIAPEACLQALAVGSAYQQPSIWPQYAMYLDQRRSRIRNVLEDLPHCDDIARPCLHTQDIGYTAPNRKSLAARYHQRALAEIHTNAPQCAPSV
jgi:hypothetical protein